MRRGLLFVFALGCLSVLSVINASPAVADSFAIDYPQAGGTAVSEVLSPDPLLEAVTLSGSLTSSIPLSDPIVAYIDGRLDSCENYFGEDPFVESGCYHAGVSRGSNWTFQMTRDQIERLGFTYYGKHTVEIRWLHRRDDGATRQSDTVTFTIAQEATSASPTAPPVAPATGDTGSQPPERSVSKLSHGSPSAPSVLSATVTAQNLDLSAGHIAVTVLVTVILLLIVGYPGLLVGSTLGDEKNYQRLFGRPIRAFAKARAWILVASPAQPRARKFSGSLTVAVGMVLATVIASCVDPGFGFNPGSLRLLASPSC